jgi:hypothetical protein
MAVQQAPHRHAPAVTNVVSACDAETSSPHVSAPDQQRTAGSQDVYVHSTSTQP